MQLPLKGTDLQALFLFVLWNGNNFMISKTTIYLQGVDWSAVVSFLELLSKIFGQYPTCFKAMPG